MRRSVVSLLVVVAACSSGQDLAPEPPTTLAPAITTEPGRPGTVTSTSTTATSTTTPPATTLPPTTTTLRPLQSLGYEEVARLDFPVQLVGWRDGLSLVATKDGRVWVMEPDADIRPTPTLDITAQVVNQGERGLLSIAVDPEDPDRLFAHYSGPGGDTVVSELTYRDGTFGDERALLRLDQPASNHNGGMIQFGPDGALYVGLGDGGGSNDRFGNGQDRSTFLGGLVRLDTHAPDAEPELFQYGLRNPWRFWIDGDHIYVADVGQNAFEEVSVVPFTADVNHGWPITEGLHCFRPTSGCDTSGITLPVIEVAHGDGGTCSITGGVVYRGTAVPEITGHFFYSDFCGGYLRSLVYEEGQVVEEADWTDQVGVPGNVTSFGLDFFGEMYVLTTGSVLRVVAVRS